MGVYGLLCTRDRCWKGLFTRNFVRLLQIVFMEYTTPTTGTITLRDMSGSDFAVYRQGSITLTSSMSFVNRLYVNYMISGGQSCSGTQRGIRLALSDSAQALSPGNHSMTGTLVWVPAVSTSLIEQENVTTLTILFSATATSSFTIQSAGIVVTMLDTTTCNQRNLLIDVFNTGAYSFISGEPIVFTYSISFT